MKNFIFIGLLLAAIFSCQVDDERPPQNSEPLTLEVFDYFESEIPFTTRSYHVRSDHDESAALGRLLFYDNRLSQNNSISCANCHNQEHGFADNKRFSVGLRNVETSRNSMTLANTALQISHFWEGHSGRMEDHILSPISNHIEMGMRSVDDLVAKLSEIEDYQRLFEELYDEPISEANINRSLTTFVASLISYNSKFDKGEEIDFINFTANELSGKELFFGKAKCGNCHRGDHFAAGWRKSANIGLDMDYQDEGAGNGRFKIPTLRNIALTAPYMHDGRFETLSEVVEHYNSGIKNHPDLDWVLDGDGLDLSDQEKEFLVEFLHTLTDYQMVQDVKFSDPFR